MARLLFTQLSKVYKEYTVQFQRYWHCGCGYTIGGTFHLMASYATRRDRSIIIILSIGYVPNSVSGGFSEFFISC